MTYRIIDFGSLQVFQVSQHVKTKDHALIIEQLTELFGLVADGLKGQAGGALSGLWYSFPNIL